MRNPITALLALSLTFAAAAQTVVPAPAHYTELDGAFTSVGPTPVYFSPGCDIDTALALSWVAEVLPTPFKTTHADSAPIKIEVNEGATGNTEGYRLRITTDRIELTADTRLGIIYGLQTIRQLGAGGTLRCAEIYDEPAYGWRSYLLDESRHFFGENVVKNIIDRLCELKMNTLHWHLTDGAGWRIEIPDYPLLTEIGAKRDYTHRSSTPQQWDSICPGRKAYYTEAQLRNISAYARARGVRIVPEIEMPGHSLAAIASYPQLGSSTPGAGKPVTGDLLNPISPFTNRFLTDVLDYVTEVLAPEYIHIGGDECDYSHWSRNDSISAYMAANDISEPWKLQYGLVHRMAARLDAKGIKTIGWNEITGHDTGLRNTTPGLVAQFWEGDASKIERAIALGYDVVNSSQLYTYLDYSYEGTPLWKCYRLLPTPHALNDEEASHVIGTGAQMWTENVPTFDRLCYQTFPRIAAIAEAAWTPSGSRSYASFIDRMQPLQQRWRREGILTTQPVYSQDEPNAIIPPGRKAPANEFPTE